MKKSVKTLVMTTVIVAAAVTVPRVFAAVPVYDAANTAENHATFLQAAQQVINSATQIANQGLELKSMSTDSLDAHANTVKAEMNTVNAILNQFTGLMTLAKTSEQVWSETFKPIDTYFENSGTLDPAALMANSQNMSYSVDQTMQDGLRTAKTIADITQDVTLLQELMEQNKNAVGNKHLGQVQNDLIAQQNALYIKQNQIQAAMVATMIASNAKQNQIEAQATAINKQYSDELDKTINAPRTLIADGKGTFK
ncbi:hypothetical protein [Sporomusa sphaeroides]|uniref:hypothetical protein n=1 Tax=Sporomusa sphaeroides TaxID=47679 RepID=UPI0031580E77